MSFSFLLLQDAGGSGEAIVVPGLLSTIDATLGVDYMTVASNILQITFGAPIAADERENWFLYSEDFTQSNWIKSESSIVATSTANPLDGELTASRVVESSSTSQHYIFQEPAGGVINNSYSFSIYLKAGTRTQAALQLGGIFGTSNAFFDLSSGVVISEADTAIGTISALLPNGFYRCTLTDVAEATDPIPAYLNIVNGGVLNYAGNGTGYIYAYGAQLRRNNEIETYIKTTSSRQTARVTGLHSTATDTIVL